MSVSLVNPEIVLEALREVVDPELGVNVVDLGLVRGIACEAGGVQVKMTLTTPGCPLHASLSGAVDQAVRLMVPGISDVEVELVWDPPWTPDAITARGRAELGWQ